jgi:hypothetical protein
MTAQALVGTWKKCVLTALVVYLALMSGLGGLCIRAYA